MSKAHKKDRRIVGIETSQSLRRYLNYKVAGIVNANDGLLLTKKSINALCELAEKFNLDLDDGNPDSPGFRINHIMLLDQLYLQKLENADTEKFISVSKSRCAEKTTT